MADEHPELVIAYMKAMIKVGRWANENKHAAGAILNRQTFYLDAEDTYQGIKDVDMVPSLSARNLECIKIGKDFMFEPRLHQARLRRGRVGPAGVPREGGRGSAQGGVGAPELEQAAPGRRARGRGRAARIAGGWAADRPQSTRDETRSGMRTILVVLMVIGSILLAFLLAGILFANLRFFMWLAIIGLVIWGIYMLVTRPWRYS